MKDRTKEVIRDGFGSLINNAAAIRGAKNGPLWLTIVFFVLSLLLPVIPVFVQQVNIKGSSFLNSYSYGLEKTVTSVALDLKNNRNVEFGIDEDHFLTVSENGNPINYEQYGSATPFAGYTNEVTGQYDLLVFVSEATKNADKKEVNSAIATTNYRLGGNIKSEQDIDIYVPSYIVLFKNGIYVVINGSNTTSAVTSSYSGDFKTIKATSTGLTDFLKVTDKDGNNVAPDMRNDTYTTGVLNSFKQVMNKSYETLKIQNVCGTTGIYVGIFAGLTIVMGLLMWILTRGKNNPNNYYSPWLTEKVSARLALAPALITLAVGFFLTSQVPLIFIMTMGLRVMWTSMKELRPIQQ